MKILILTTKYTHIDGSPWLISELVDSFDKQGASVTILHLDWSGKLGRLNASRISNICLSRYTCLCRSVGPLSLFFKWALSSLKLLIPLIRMKVMRQRYDLFIGFSPCVATYAAHPLAHSLSDRSLLIYWDFFPVHNQQISSKIPSFLLPPLKWLENRLVSRFGKIGLMSEANLKFAKSYFDNISDDQLSIIPPWTSYLQSPLVRDYDIKRLCGFDQNRVVCVFGGQLVEGRGVTEICHAVIEANKMNPQICLCIFGDGNLADEVNFYALKYPNVVYYMGSVSRDQYLQALSISDIGIVATIKGVSAPTYPSKSLDYMAAQLPILASVEEASDFGEIVVKNKFGLYSIAGDQESFTENLVQLSFSSEMRLMLGENGFNYLNSHHSVDIVSKAILDGI